MPLPFVYRVTKYNPADRNEHGHYAGPEDVRSDCGPKEAAYLLAVREMAAELGLSHLTVRNPSLPSFVNFGLEAPIEGAGLTGLIPDGAEGFYDGLEVDLDSAVELVRGMLRDYGASCTLEDVGVFSVEIGYDQYMYIEVASESHGWLSSVRDSGLFAERIDSSPWSRESTGQQLEARVADRSIWASLEELVRARGSVLLRAAWAANAWHYFRLLPDDADSVRATLKPRSYLEVWPDLVDDIPAVSARAEALGFAEVIWQEASGGVLSTFHSVESDLDLSEHLGTATAAAVHSGYADDYEPLLIGVIPDPDGVLRAQWPLIKDPQAD